MTRGEYSGPKKGEALVGDEVKVFEDERWWKVLGYIPRCPRLRLPRQVVLREAGKDTGASCVRAAFVTDRRRA